MSSVVHRPLTGSRLFVDVLKLYGLAMSLISLAGFPLLLLAIDVDELRSVVPLLGAAFVAMIIVTSVDLWALSRQLAPAKRWLDAASPVKADPALSRAALVRILELPYLNLRRVVLVHAPVAFVSFFTGCAALGINVWPPERHIVAAALLMIASSMWEAQFEFFALNRRLRSWTEPLQAHPEFGNALSEARAVGVRGKLVLTSVGLVFVPIVLLAGTLLTRVWPLYEAVPDETPFAILRYTAALVVVTLLGGWSVARLLSQDTTRPLSELLRAMQALREGRFEQRLAVSRPDEFGRAFDGFNDMARGLGERERLRDAFGRYLAPELAQRVLTDAPALGGEVISGTVLFADIRGFTTLSEQLSPQEIVGLLNGYFAAVEPALHAHRGWINKFGGDSLLAVFGAPVRQEEHATNAVKAALAMRQALADFNAKQRAAGLNEVAIGIGIHSGEMVAGNVGSPTRLEYTVIGDVVNAAARLQALTKEHGVDVLLSRTTWALSRLEVPVEQVGDLVLRGKSEPLAVLALRSEPGVSEPRPLAAAR